MEAAAAPDNGVYAHVHPASVGARAHPVPFLLAYGGALYNLSLAAAAPPTQRVWHIAQRAVHNMRVQDVLVQYAPGAAPVRVQRSTWLAQLGGSARVIVRVSKTPPHRKK